MKIAANELKPLFEQHESEYISAAQRVLRSGWYILGPEVEAFEHKFAAWLGSKHCIGLNSGMDALELAVRALKIGQGDEVIVQGNTYIATVLAITENKATPVFVEPDDYHGIDPQKIEAAITRNTKAIMVVHLYGHPCDMDSVMAIANRYKLPVIEDCAQSHGATWKGKNTGTFGTIGCFSFFPTKNLGAFGDAGAIVTNDPSLADQIKMLRNYGSQKKYYNETTGKNSRLDEIQAALLQVKLSRIEEIIAERRVMAQKFLCGIHNKLVELPRVRKEANPVWHQFVVCCEKRNELKQHLHDNGIETIIHYPIPPHLADAYKYLGHGKGSFPKTEHLANTVLSLPLFHGLDNEQINYIIDIMNSYQ